MKGALRRRNGGGGGSSSTASRINRFWLLAPQAFLVLPSLTTHHQPHRHLHQQHVYIGPPSSSSSTRRLDTSLRLSSSTTTTTSSSSSSSSSLSSTAPPPAASISDDATGIKLPKAVSPSSLGDFKTCPRLYRFRHIERIPEPPSEVMVRGSMVHDALDQLYEEPPANRTLQVLHDLFRKVWLKGKDKYAQELFPTVDRQRSFGQAGLKLLTNYFTVERPEALEPFLREFRMRVSLPGGGPNVTGICDRVDESKDGELMIIDYKTGKAPNLKYSDAVNQRIVNDKFFQLKVYAMLLGEIKQRTPTQLKLIYLDGPTVISMDLKEGDIDEAKQELTNIWSQILEAAQYDEFVTKPGKLCDWCSFKSICPAWSFQTPAATTNTTTAAVAAAATEEIVPVVTDSSSTIKADASGAAAAATAAAAAVLPADEFTAILNEGGTGGGGGGFVLSSPGVTLGMTGDGDLIIGGEEDEEEGPSSPPPPPSVKKGSGRGRKKAAVVSTSDSVDSDNSVLVEEEIAVKKARTSRKRTGRSKAKSSAATAADDDDPSVLIDKGHSHKDGNVVVGMAPSSSLSSSS